MGEILDLPILEQFRDSKHKSLYWVEDAQSAHSILQHYVTNHIPFGMEIGFGYNPTRVFLVDASLDWILTELDKDAFAFAKSCNLFGVRWDEEHIKNFTTKKIFALNIPADKTTVQAAKVLVYCNLDYRKEMVGLVPNFSELKKGQRVVFIVTRAHADGAGGGELPLYREFLTACGYDSASLVRRPGIISKPVINDDDDEYVLDITKI